MTKLALGLFLATGLTLLAQSDRATITGRVLDATSAPIPGATLTATNQATGVKYTSTTNEAGNYLVQQIPYGRYDFTAEAAGFRRLVRKDVDISVGQTLTLDLTMEIGQVEQQIEVVGSAPVVESSTSDVSTTVTSRQVMDLPLSVSGNMRNPEQFIFLTPGVTGSAVIPDQRFAIARQGDSV